MTIPKISMTCFLAQLSKATKKSPYEFAHDFMLKMTEEQPELMACLAAMIKPIVEIPVEVEEVPSDIATELCVTACFVVLGVTLESISATIDAEEMNNAWS